MKLITQSFVFVLLNISVLTPVSAGSFSDSFKSWVLDDETSAPAAKTETVRLDVSSAECMGCHNGKDSGHIVVKSANSAMQFTSSGRQSNHPIGMRYDDYAANDPASYRSSATLDPNIRLVGGRVACVSCHQLKDRSGNTPHGVSFDPYQKVSTRSLSNNNAAASTMTLTVGPRVTDLCMACHTI
ncbi:MAG: hypothetical protein OEY09_19645 [Gammaproteobacteria bacterium]|nr:hypothetical protein [Gammaproteobacteria bacterium]